MNWTKTRARKALNASTDAELGRMVGVSRQYINRHKGGQPLAPKLLRKFQTKWPAIFGKP